MQILKKTKEVGTGNSRPPKVNKNKADIRPYYTAPKAWRKFI